jgi:hypothetical protein
MTASTHADVTGPLASRTDAVTVEPVATTGVLNVVVGASAANAVVGVTRVSAVETGGPSGSVACDDDVVASVLDVTSPRSPTPAAFVRAVERVATVITPVESATKIQTATIRDSQERTPFALSMMNHPFATPTDRYTPSVGGLPI